MAVEPAAAAVDVIALQPVAVVDHSIKVEAPFLETIDGDIGGSLRISEPELEALVARLPGPHTSKVCREGGDGCLTTCLPG